MLELNTYTIDLLVDGVHIPCNTFVTPFMVIIITTCTYVKLLGPCCKTGQEQYICIHKQVASDNHLWKYHVCMLCIKHEALHMRACLYAMFVFLNTHVWSHDDTHCMHHTQNRWYNTTCSYIQHHTTGSACTWQMSQSTNPNMHVDANPTFQSGANYRPVLKSGCTNERMNLNGS